MTVSDTGAHLPRAVPTEGALSQHVRMAVLLSAVLFPASIAAAQSASDASARFERTGPTENAVLHVDAPPEPIAPEVITRDAEGRATVRAVRVSQPLRIDGALDEALYRDVRRSQISSRSSPTAARPPPNGPRRGSPSTTTMCMCRSGCGTARWTPLIATEMRRDSTNSWQGNDLVSFIFDTFYDRRSSFTFTMNPLGGRSDGTMVNDRQYSSDWNPVWETKTGRFDGGWTVEAAVPFKSLRYQPGTAQVWGFNAMRVKRSKNEVSTLTRVPPARGQSGFQRAQFAATLVGIEAPRGGANLDVKPYAISSLTTDRLVTPQRIEPSGGRGRPRREVCGHAGTGRRPDGQHRLRAGRGRRTADQPHAVQSVLSGETRLLPGEPGHVLLRRRGDQQRRRQLRRRLHRQQQRRADPVLQPPDRVARESRRCRSTSAGGSPAAPARSVVGVLNIQTGDKEEELGAPATNFSVIRVKRDVLRRSSIGLLFTNRSESTIGPGANRSYGIDGTFAFFENLQINTYWARNRHRRAEHAGQHDSYRGQLDYSGDRYTVQVERLKIGDNFNPEMGFVRRDDMVRDYARFKFSPRPRQPERDPQVRLRRLDRVHRERRRAARVARARGRIRARVPERRSLQRQLHQLVRVPAGADADRQRRAAGRRTTSSTRSASATTSASNASCRQT